MSDFTPEEREKIEDLKARIKKERRLMRDAGEAIRRDRLIATQALKEANEEAERDAEAEEKALRAAASMDTRSFNRVMRVVEKLRSGDKFLEGK
jgi:hypothetical protein